MNPEVFKFTGTKRSLKPETPLKKLLNLPRKLKAKITDKSSSLWKYPTKNKKRKFQADIENENSRKKYKSKYTSPGDEIKMAVIHAEHPAVDLTPYQIKLVTRTIDDGLQDASGFWGSDLDIIDVYHKKGIVWVICGNRRTVNWLWETVHSLGDSEDRILLRVVESRFLPVVSDYFWEDKF